MKVTMHKVPPPPKPRWVFGLSPGNWDGGWRKETSAAPARRKVAHLCIAASMAGATDQGFTPGLKPT